MQTRQRGSCLLSLAAGMLSGSFSAFALQGTVSGFPALTDKTTLGAAIVMPSIRAGDLISLQINDALSPDELMKATFTSVKVPGNLFVPPQTISYSGFSITMTKPTFTSLLSRGATNELAAIEMSGPADKIADLVLDKAPLNQLLALVSINSMGFEGDRDWSTATSPFNLALNQTRASTGSYAWARSAAPAKTQDLMVALQQTPAGRWLPSDFSSPPPATGSLGSFANLSPRLKVFFMRILVSGTATDKIPSSVVGRIADIAANGAAVASEPPENFSGVALNSNTVTWNPIGDNGWVGILRTPAAAAVNQFGSLVAWVNPAAGSYAFDNALGSDKVALLFIGADRPVPAPVADAISDVEPVLFTFANELRYFAIS